MRGSLAELLERWMAHLEVQGRAPATLVRYRSAIAANIVPALGHIDVDKLSASDLDAIYASLLARGPSATHNVISSNRTRQPRSPRSDGGSRRS